LIRQQAREAIYNGTNADLWRQWRSSVAELGVPLHDAIELLNREGLRWYGRFAFDEGLGDEGIKAYEKLLEGNSSEEWIFSQDAVRYLQEVEARSGPQAVLDAYAAFEKIDPKGYPMVQRLVADAQAKLGRTDAALARMREVTARYHIDGENHAALARHALAAGLGDEARRSLVAAAKRGVVSPPEPSHRVNLDAGDLKRVADQYQTPDEDALVEAFVRSPGLTMLPAAEGEASPHVYGGGELQLPACPGCRVTLMLIASIDSAAAASHEPTLAPLVKTLPRLPIMHCANCQFMFSLPDYLVWEDARRIEIYNWMSLGRSNAIFDKPNTLTRQAAILVTPKPVASGDAYDAANELDRQRWSGPQIGGAPRPINQPRRRFCPRCDAEQIFYAAICEANAFTTPVIVNPDGYMYFFACPACRIISTDLDNT
jgi:hypothetical protein